MSHVIASNHRDSSSDVKFGLIQVKLLRKWPGLDTTSVGAQNITVFVKSGRLEQSKESNNNLDSTKS